jgi:amidase
MVERIGDPRRLRTLMTIPRKGSPFVPHDTGRIEGSPGGPLEGLSFVAKDMFDIAGERTGGGSPEWLADADPAERHAVSVAQLLAAGASLVGKTVCDELFYSITGENAHYGTPVNPRSPHRLPGGSSSGSAAAVSAGACDIGLGSDTGGSIRIPASFCGVFGIRPSVGRVESAGAMPMAPTFDTVGWLAPSSGVLRTVGKVLLQGDPTPASVEKVLAPIELTEDLPDAVVRSGFDEFRSRVIERSFDIEELRLAGGSGLARWGECFRIIQGFEFWATFGEWIRARRPELGPGIRERAEAASKISSEATAQARAEHQTIMGGLLDLLRPGTVLMVPTAPCVAPQRGLGADDLAEVRSRIMSYTCVAGLGGLPQISAPICSGSGLPCGFSFIGWQGGDEVLLDLVHELAPYYAL